MASILFECVAMDVKLYKKYKQSTDQTMQPQPLFQRQLSYGSQNQKKL